MNKVNVAVIGYGHLGKWHTQKANALETANLVAIVEPFEANKVSAKESYPEVKVVDTIDEVINDVDAVVIVTPTSTHFELVKKILAHDKHIFCEKPLCSNFQEVSELKSQLTDKIVQVGHSERCHAAWEALKPVFKEIKGKKTIKLTRFAPFKGRATDVDVVSDLMIHDLDLMLYLFESKPTHVSSLGHKIRTDKWDHVTSHFFLENDDEVIITSGRNHTHEVRSLEVMSAQGCHYVDLFKNETSYATNKQFEDESFVKTSSYEKRDHLLIEQTKFYDSILNNTKSFVDYEDGANAVFYISEVLRSLESQGLVKINNG